MRPVPQLMLSTLVLVTFAGSTAAVPLSFQLDNVTIAGAPTASTQTWVPGFPITGAGDIDFGLGTGWLSLPDHSILIDIDFTGPGVDAQIDVSGWGQTISAIDVSGNITSTGSGSYACPYPISVCAVGPPAGTGWPPVDGGSPSSAVIDLGLQTITVIDASDTASTGTVTYFYSYTVVPEPGTALLVGGGIVVFGFIRRRGRA